MGEPASGVIGLTVAGCRARQQRLVHQLQSESVEALLVCDRRHVYYLSGYWGASHHCPLMLITTQATSHLALPDPNEVEHLAADQLSAYEAQRHCTLIEDQFGAALRPLLGEIGGFQCLGIDLPQLSWPATGHVRDMSSAMLTLRRKKEEDEVALIRHAVRACEAAYARAAEILRPGIREIDVYAEVQAAAIKELGEPIGELGNDFQAGTPGGPPRTRPVEFGELMPLDVTVSVRGYRCDLCRTFAIGRQPTAKQQEAARLVAQAMQYAEHNIRPGGSCRRLFDEVHRQLQGVNGWQFFHHLGHGTGLSPHEAPRINPHWDEYFEVGDVFTLEPGLYHDDLRAGVRTEQNYWLSPDGLVRLSSVPETL